MVLGLNFKSILITVLKEQWTKSSKTPGNNHDCLECMALTHTYFFELQVLHLIHEVVIYVLPKSQGCCVDRISNVCGWYTGKYKAYYYYCSLTEKAKRLKAHAHD